MELSSSSLYDKKVVIKRRDNEELRSFGIESRALEMRITGSKRTQINFLPFHKLFPHKNRTAINLAAQFVPFIDRPFRSAFPFDGRRMFLRSFTNHSLLIPEKRKDPHFFCSSPFTLNSFFFPSFAFVPPLGNLTRPDIFLRVESLWLRAAKLLF